MSNCFECNIGEGDANVTVYYDYDGGSAGDYYQPPEPESVEILSVWYKYLDIIATIDNQIIEYLEEKAIQDMNEQYNAMLDARAEAEYENRKLEQYGY